MKTATTGWLGALSLGIACSSPSTVPEPAPLPPPAASVSATAPLPTASAPLTAPTPSPEEQRKAKDREQLLVDWATFQREDAAEVARLTPEVHAATKALAERSYPNVHAALGAAVAGGHRKPGNSARDPYRHPRETLEFFGLTPTETVLEYGPGDGWFTEVLAPVLARKGTLIVTTPDPNGPKDERSALYAERTRRFLARLPEAYGKVRTVVADPKAPNLGADQSVDLVLFSRGAHGLNNEGNLLAYLGEFHRVLKRKGVLGVEQHRAPADANPAESSKRGYLPEAWLVSEIEKAGFKLAARSEINANPKDTKDYPEGVWTLPPALRLGDKDREKYLAIGESDRMTLRFVKLDEKKPAPATPPKAASTPP